jgi:hypothetical protein
MRRGGPKKPTAREDAKSENGEYAGSVAYARKSAERTSRMPDGAF